MKKWGFGFSAAGNIAGRMAALLRQMDEVYLAAVFSRQAEKGAAFEARYGFKKNYTHFEALLKDPMVDIVYIATPHSLHFSQAKMALEAKKHVLCEKPLVLNARQAEILQETALKNGRICMEAMWTRFLPAWHKAKEVADSGVIGPVVSLEGSFGGRSMDVPRIAKKVLGGGALMDVGVYLLHSTAMMMGADIATIESSSLLSDEGIDCQNALILRSAEGIIASLTSSALSPLGNAFHIYGEKGSIHLPHFWDAQRVEVRYDNNGSLAEEAFAYPHPHNDGFYYQVKALLAAIKAGEADCPAMPMAESIRILKQTDLIRRQWGMTYPQDEELA